MKNDKPLKRLVSSDVQTTNTNRALLKARYKVFLSTIDDDIAAVTNVATAKTAMTKMLKMIKVLARFIYQESDGE